MKALLFAFSFLLYAGTIGYDFALDDVAAVKKNVYVQQGVTAIPRLLTTSFWAGYDPTLPPWTYRPLSLILFAIEGQLFGNNPRTYHFFNVLFYALSVSLLYLFLRRLLRHHHPAVPFSITLIFASHPIHTEAVANIKSRDEILSFLFMVLASLLLLSYARRPRRRTLFFSGCAFFFCLLGKESGIAFLAVIPLLLYFFSDLGAAAGLRITLIYALITGLYLALRTQVVGSLLLQGEIPLISNSLVAARTAAERSATNFLILGKYLRLLFLPHPLSWDYSYRQIPLVGWSDPRALASLGIYTAGIGGALWGLPKKNPVAFGVLFYLVTLAPTSNLLFNLRWTMGERFLFTPSLGLCLAVGVLLAGLFHVGKDVHEKGRRIFIATVVGIVAVFSGLTVARNPVWRNDWTLAWDGVETAPGSARTHYALGKALQDRAALVDVDEGAPRRELLGQAAQAYRKSIEILENYPEPHFGLGVTYQLLGDDARALEEYLFVVRYNAAYAPAYHNIGSIIFNRGEYARCLPLLEKALSLQPDNPEFRRSYELASSRIRGARSSAAPASIR